MYVGGIVLSVLGAIGAFFGCNYRVDARLVDFQPTPVAGVCRLSVSYDSGGRAVDTEVTADCPAEGAHTVRGCYGRMRPANFKVYTRRCGDGCVPVNDFAACLGMFCTGGALLAAAGIVDAIRSRQARPPPYDQLELHPLRASMN